MRELLDVPDELDGRLWRYEYSGSARHTHRHDEIEFNLVMRGACSYLLDDRRYEMRRHSLVWLFPGQDHVLLHETTDLQMWILVLKPGALRRLCTTETTSVLLQANPGGSFCKRLAPNAVQRLTELMDELYPASDAAALYNAGLGYLLLTAWADFCRGGVVEAGRGVHPAIEKAAHLLRRDLDGGSLNELASKVGLSPARLSRLFKQQTGVPLATFRNRRRIELFLSLIEDGQPKLLDAALKAGFGSYAQFHRVFKETMNCSPSEYCRRKS